MLKTRKDTHLTLQYSIACPGLATRTLAGLCALWLPSTASSSGNLNQPAKPLPQQGANTKSQVTMIAHGNCDHQRVFDDYYMKMGDKHLIPQRISAARRPRR